MTPNKTADNRNMFLFIALSMVILFGYQFFVLNPQMEKEQVAREKAAAVAKANTPVAGAAPAPVTLAAPVAREKAVGLTERVQINTPSLKGSLSLTGARFDDLFLTKYKETIDKNSPAVELFRPEGAKHAFFADSGWLGQNINGLPNASTQWTLQSGTVLSVGKNIVLGYDNGAGLRFERTYAVDENYMITITEKVINTSGVAVTVAPYASVTRQGVPDQLGTNMILHEGGVGVFDNKLKEFKYKDWQKKKTFEAESTGGWLGITDKYWMASVIPAQNEKVKAAFRASEVEGVQVLQAGYVAAPVTIAPGTQITETHHLFAGAKVATILTTYQENLGLPSFDKAIDWGNFWFLTRPMFWVLDQLYQFMGNFGLAILGLTVVVKLIFYPLAHKSYESMTKMKMLQPKVEELKKKYEGDAQKMQIEMMNMYQKEKVNPMTGCLPMLLQIPVFYALYKVLFVTIEMRHAPFFGYINDLSARDPSTIFNLFGLIPYDPAAVPLIGSILGGPLHIGIVAILYGFTMWLTQGMNPPAPDPIQRKIFAFMPLMFTFIMAPFAVGLLIYWTWSNVLTIAQQYSIMHRLKVENPIDTFIGKFRKPTAETTQTAAVTAIAGDDDGKVIKGEVISGGTSASGTKRSRKTKKDI
ncbi:membrane protein insertase YidC [Asticcacaulis machinosus]|uniref:Membrane protein insertase YidC n=1 Tax=Asticcacaulis machinosus TaxID=2984211 RepID=A0ABT5HJ77_9CAUL|nr:membrane protein insertase YidC [Asticcacaulis machinosus]MDC7676304.1 membrane protein insertase YidC [Asticcacaulis machinosus]